MSLLNRLLFTRIDLEDLSLEYDKIPNFIKSNYSHKNLKWE